MKKSSFLLILFISMQVQAQTHSKNLHLKPFLAQNDSIQIDSVSISAANFKVFSETNIEIDTSNYRTKFERRLFLGRDL